MELKYRLSAILPSIITLGSATYVGFFALSTWAYGLIPIGISFFVSEACRQLKSSNLRNKKANVLSVLRDLERKEVKLEKKFRHVKGVMRGINGSEYHFIGGLDTEKIDDIKKNLIKVGYEESNERLKKIYEQHKKSDQGNENIQQKKEYINS